MGQLLHHTGYMLAALILAPVYALLRIKRRRYEVWADIHAPRGLVWSLVTAKNVRLDGLVPIDIAVRPRYGATDIVDGTLKIGDQELAISYKLIEERAPEGLVMQLRKEDCDPRVCPGDDYIIAVALSEFDGDQGAITRLTLIHELTHGTFASRFAVPLGVLMNVLRLKRNAETRGGRRQDDIAAAVRAALVTGLLTFASFFALYGASTAGILIAVILIHEVGHAIAMRWVGIPLKGIYFIPFLGGVAVGANRYRDQGERGLVALMGPGFSIASTALFVFLAEQERSPVLIELAVLSAVVNGLNLLPIPPLDGGQIVNALLSGFEESVAKLVQLVGLLGGFSLAIALQSYLLCALLALTIPSIFRDANESLLSAPIAEWPAALLLTGYLAALGFYSLVIWRYFFT